MNEAEKPEYAPCWARTAAMVADALILMLLLILMQQFIADVQLQTIIYQAGSVLYFILLEGSRRQASLGKSLLKIYVATTSGGRAAFSRIVVRYVIWTFFGLPFVALTVSSDYAHFVQTLRHSMATGGNAAATAYMESAEGHALIAKLWICFFVYAAPSIVLYWLPLIFTREKTGLHDFLTRTRVYKKTEAG